MRFKTILVLISCVAGTLGPGIASAGVVTEQGEITCEHVVNAAGCYARDVGRWVGVETPITNMEHHYIVTETVSQFVERNEEIPVFRDPRASAYYRQEQKSGLIGLYEPHGQEAWASRGGAPEWESENELFEPAFDRISDCLEVVFERMSDELTVPRFRPRGDVV